MEATDMPSEEMKTPTIPARDTWRLLRRLLPISFAVALTLTFGTTDAWAKTAATAPVTETASETSTRAPETTQATQPSFEDAYAQREQATPGLENFEGGDIVIIGSTGLIILLLILLILLL
jgi:hypothetical protein